MKNRFIDDYLLEVQEGIIGLTRSEIVQVFEALTKARVDEKFIFIIGNGGSASTASHFAHDLVKSTYLEGRTRFKAIALSDNVPIITAVANDRSYELVFKEQLAALATKGDILITFSGSGNSPNVLAAVDWAVANGLVTIGFTGQPPNRLEEKVHLCVRVPNRIMGQVEGIHLVLTQLLYKMLKEL